MERIYVAVRARPLSPEEASSSPWRISGNSIFLSNQFTKFEFDRVFSEECKTGDVYEARTKKIVESAVCGFNGTVFAYGQTSSGKTHTMRGTPNEAGVIPLAVYDLFRTIEKDISREFLVRMSYMEIYNEEINDLLVPEHRKLQIHESLERGIFVSGLREEIVTTPDQVLALMEFGESHRQIGETNMNLYSSRSHTIFRMIIESREKAKDDDGEDSCNAVRVSFLNLVDLAGSERAAKTGAEGVRLKEGSHINKSLMTLGTIIKKLSEGAEGQGCHVPYRDSKLTRILQPALGGNANTAMICNITLAQIHADETKSSLQFASRATHVKNCACVNEVLTDAALLKRQKKEIEELREKLLGSHSEHLEKEILNLRNTLLQSELEKERIVLELEEEKKAKAAREKRLKEQAQKIANLSSMVLYSNREEDAFPSQEKRRQTWCPVSLSRLSMLGNPMKDPITMRKLDRGQNEEHLPEKSEFGKEETNEDTQSCVDFENSGFSSNFNLHDARSFAHVTDRRKVRHKNRRLAKMVEEDSGLKHADENKLPANSSVSQLNENINFVFQSLTARESEAIHVIKQLEDKTKELETEKRSVQNNLDSVMDLVTHQNIDFKNKYDEVYKELLGAREEAKISNEELMSLKSLNASKEVKDAFYEELSVEIEGVVAEFCHYRDIVDNLSLMVENLCQSFSVLSNVFLEVKEFAPKDIKEVISQWFQAHPSLPVSTEPIEQEVVHLRWNRSPLFNNLVHEKIHTFMKTRNKELESEKVFLLNESLNYSKKVEEVKSELHSLEESMQKQKLMDDLEKDGLYHQIVELKNEISRLPTSTVAKEKELLKKDLEKTETKLKETQFKLNNALQDKIKLESEKAQIERETKNLQNQKVLLERDICKRDSLVERRHDPKLADISNVKGHAKNAKHAQKLELLELRASEMELEIASLKQDLLTLAKEKQDAISNHEILSLELDDMSTKLSELRDTSKKMDSVKSELQLLKNELDAKTRRLEESESSSLNLKKTIDVLAIEKEQLTEQLTNSLLELEMDKAAITDLEKNLSEANERIKILDNQIDTLSNGFSEQLSSSLLELEMEKASRSSLEKDLLEAKQRIQMSDNKISTLSDDLLKLRKIKEVVVELTGKIAAMETKMHVDALIHVKEKTELKIQLEGKQVKLDTYRGRCKDIFSKMELMKKNYTEAVEKYHQQLASYAVQILRLKGRPVTSEELALTSSTS